MIAGAASSFGTIVDTSDPDGAEAERADHDGDDEAQVAVGERDAVDHEPEQRSSARSG